MEREVFAVNIMSEENQLSANAETISPNATTLAYNFFASPVDKVMLSVPSSSGVKSPPAEQIVAAAQPTITVPVLLDDLQQLANAAHNVVYLGERQNTMVKIHDLSLGINANLRSYLRLSKICSPLLMLTGPWN